MDLDRVAEELDDASAAMSARTVEAQRILDRKKLTRARRRLREARVHRAEVRAALLLDGDD